VFEGEDKDAIIAQFIRDGLAAHAAKIVHEAVSESVPDLVLQFRELRKGMPAVSKEEIRRLREEGRH
jgi:hypothetical protein